MLTAGCRVHLQNLGCTLCYRDNNTESQYDRGTNQMKDDLRMAHEVVRAFVSSTELRASYLRVGQSKQDLRWREGG